MAIIRKNMRHGPDGMVKWMRFLTFLSWLLLFSAFIIISLSRPRYDTMFNRFADTMTYDTWDKTLLEYAFYIFIPLTILSLIGLAINKQRRKRRTDAYRISLVITGFLSLLGIFAYYLMYIR